MSDITIADMMLYLSDAEQRRQLEDFRIQYEAVHGETDLTRRYTSTWPTEQQEALIELDTKRYFDGLPPFVKAFMYAKIKMAANKGRLDDMPAQLLRLYVTHQMVLDH